MSALLFPGIGSLVITADGAVGEATPEQQQIALTEGGEGTVTAASNAIHVSFGTLIRLVNGILSAAQ